VEVAINRRPESNEGSQCAAKGDLREFAWRDAAEKTVDQAVLLT